MADKSGRVLVIGSSNTDMVVKCSRLPRPGQTVTGGTFVMVPGGKGANQAVAAARLGAKVTFVARVGNDSFGQAAIAGYQAEGIDTSYILRDPEAHTGVALIIVDEQGENLIAVASGANHRLSPEDVRRAAAVFRQADVVLLQLEIPLETVQAAVTLAGEVGVPVILNPAPAFPLPDELLRHVTYLTPNESETEGLTGLSVGDESSAREAARVLRDRGVRHVIITLGPKGALVVGPEEARLVPAYQVQAVDTTAAGDAFSGALAAGLAKGMTLGEAVEYATRAAAISVTRMGAQPSLPTHAEVERFSAPRR
ncbi:MAG: ribokinase [Thermoguttaceae bacterium]|nr:ribokinase [Thermoguttaceae bacterium]MDW8078237.1 ribokinase [Thermoguttaceae bacterium]